MHQTVKNDGLAKSTVRFVIKGWGKYKASVLEYKDKERNGRPLKFSQRFAPVPAFCLTSANLQVLTGIAENVAGDLPTLDFLKLRPFHIHADPREDERNTAPEEFAKCTGIMVWCAINSEGQVVVRRSPDRLDATAYVNLF